MAALGRTLQRSDLSKLIGLTATVDEDVLELDGLTNEEGESVESLGARLEEHEARAVEFSKPADRTRPKGKCTKLEAIWDFYFTEPESFEQARTLTDPDCMVSQSMGS